MTMWKNNYWQVLDAKTHLRERQMDDLRIVSNDLFVKICEE